MSAKKNIFMPKGCTLDAKLTNANCLQVSALLGEKQGTLSRCLGFELALLGTAKSHIRHNTPFVWEKDTKRTPRLGLGAQEKETQEKKQFFHSASMNRTIEGHPTTTMRRDHSLGCSRSKCIPG